MRGKRTVHHRVISARKRAMLRGVSPKLNGSFLSESQEPFTSPFAALLGENRQTSVSGLTSFRDTCQAHLRTLAIEIKASLLQKNFPKKGGVKFRLIPRLLENYEYKKFLGEAYAEEVIASSTPFIKALGLVLFDLGMPTVSTFKSITPLPGGWLDLLVRGAQALIPEWRVSIQARKTSVGGKVELLLCLDRVDATVRSLSNSDLNRSELIH